MLYFLFKISRIFNTTGAATFRQTLFRNALQWLLSRRYVVV